MNDEEFLRSTTLYLEDAIDDEELELLSVELANSSGRVRQFNDLRLVAGLIHEHGRTIETTSEFDLGTGLKHEKKIAEKSFGSGSFENQGNRDSSLPVTTSAFAITTMLLVVALSLAVFLNGRDSSSSSERSEAAIATLDYVSNARWGGEEQVPGDALGKGKQSLEIGLARLGFRNGVTVTLQGPAEFEVLSTSKMIFTSGILTASIPKSAIGFEVLTPTMDVVDLGTAFGVSVGGNGETDVCVFEGEVEVCLADSGDTPKLVREGQAVRSRPQSNSIDSVNYSTGRFEDAWPVTSGVLQATGLMNFVSPGPNFVPGRYEDSERILVFRERSQVLLESDLEVNVTEPGQYVRVHRDQKKSLAAGQIIRSYLLQLNPIGQFGRQETDGARVIGQITFDRPILGLIGGTTQLINTDALLGHPLGSYGDTRRGIEPTRPNDLPGSGRDKVTLSSNRRTLSLDLSASSAVDQIRVLVSESY